MFQLNTDSSSQEQLLLQAEHKQPLAGAGSKQRLVAAQLQLDGAPETPALLLLTTTQPPNLSEMYPHQPISTFTVRFLQARP